MDNNQLVDEICQQNNVSMGKHRFDLPQLKSAQGSGQNEAMIDDDGKIDQNLFKDFDYNNKVGHIEGNQ